MFEMASITIVLAFLLKAIGPILGTLVGLFLGSWQSNRTWKKKEFKGSILVSLNMIENYENIDENENVASLKLRTLFERKLDEVISHPAMRKKINQAIKEAKEGDPILRFSKDDAWFILNMIRNKITEQIAIGTLRADMGAEVIRETYTLCVTFEREENMNQHKTRVFLFHRTNFLAFPDSGNIKLESPKHTVRVETIRKLKKEYKENHHLFADMEIVL